MTFTSVHCAACGWESWNHPTCAEAAIAGLSHLKERHPNMTEAHNGAAQLRLFAYLTVAEYLEAREADTTEQPAQKPQPQPQEPKHNHDDDDEPPTPKKGAPKPAAPTRKLGTRR